LLRELQEKLDMAMLLITHDLGVVANVADEVVVIYHGEIMEAGTVEDIFRRPSHPYLKALMAAVPHFDMRPGERLKALREVPVNAAKLMEHSRKQPAATGDGVLLSVRNWSRASPAGNPAGSARARTSRSAPSTMSASTSGAANASGSSAKAAAARPPSARS
jgi:ABC-type glutathione transport system ATPase component